MEERVNGALAAAMAEHDAKAQEDLDNQDKTDDFWYDASTDEFYHVRRRASYTRTVLNNIIPRETLPLMDVGSGKSKRIEADRVIANPSMGRTFHSHTWIPGADQFLHGQQFTATGMFPVAGSIALNEFVPPHPFIGGSATKALRIREHIYALWDAEVAEWIIGFFAHMIQSPGEKCNTIVGMCGEQGAGKDTTIDCFAEIIGRNNIAYVQPDAIMSGFNHYVRAVLMVISEARPEHSVRKSEFYERLKGLAAPPHYLTINEKYKPLLAVKNIVRTIITFNELHSLHIDPNDRRVLVAETRQPKGWQPDSYFAELRSWAATDGAADIDAWMRSYDLSKWNPNNPPYTDAKRVIINQYETEDDILFDALDELKFPEVVWAELLWATKVAGFDGGDILRKRINNGIHWARDMAKHGYVRVPFDKNDSPVWQFRFGKDKRIKCKVVYAKRGVKLDREKVRAAMRAVYDPNGTDNDDES